MMRENPIRFNKSNVSNTVVYNDIVVYKDLGQLLAQVS